MPSYGYQVLGTDPKDIQLTADGNPQRPPIGITLDWSTFTAVSGSDQTLPDGTVIAIGRRGFRYGQVLTRITASGKFGPYDTGASDGRQTLKRGDVVIANSTWLELPIALLAVATDFPDVIEGGLVWKARLLAAATGTATVPSYAALEAVLPLLRYAQ